MRAFVLRVDGCHGHAESSEHARAVGHDCTFGHVEQRRWRHHGQSRPKRRPCPWHPWIAVPLVLLALLPSCTTEPVRQPAPPPPPVTQHIQRGPVDFTVTAAPGAILVGELLTLTIEVLTEPGVAVTMPGFADTIGQFAIEDSQRPPDVPVPADSGTSRGSGGRRWLHTYTLSTWDAGDLEIPPIMLAFADRRDRANAIAGELTTDPLRISVQTVLPPGEPDPTGLRDIKAAVDVPVDRPGADWVIITATLLALAGILLVAISLLRRRNARAATAEVPPHIWALLQLDRLGNEDLIGRGEVHTFYYRLSDIVRTYIERRYGLKAPERTTEEFLREMRASPVLDVGHKELLAGFLRAADLVKFARHEPAPEDCQEALDSASRFVRDTSPHEADAADELSAGAEATREAAA